MLICSQIPVCVQTEAGLAVLVWISGQSNSVPYPWQRSVLDN